MRLATRSAVWAVVSISLSCLLPREGLGQPVSFDVNLLKQINEHPGANDVWGYTGGGVELAIYGHATGTSFVDATDPANAVEIYNISGPPSTWRDIKTYQNYAYIVTEGDSEGTGLQIVDLTNPLSPDSVTTFNGSGFSSAHNIWIDTGAGIAYACGAPGGTRILSLADPENPVQIDNFSQYYVHDLWVGGGLAYMGAISSGSLRIADVTTPSNPITIASHFYSGAATHNAWPNAAGTHCVTSDETAGGHLLVWDITNLGNITLAGEFGVTGQIIHNALIKNDIAYCSWYGAGTRIVDINDPTKPTEIGYYDTSTGGGFQGNWGTYPFRSDDIFYSSDRQNGLFILEFVGSLAGDLSGTVRDATTTSVISGASIELIGGQGGTLASDGSGAYAGRFPSDNYTLITSKFGYATDTSAVFVPESGAAVLDIDLVALPLGSVELVLTTTEGPAPIANAAVEALETPLAPTTTDGSGTAMVTGLPAGQTWTCQIGKFGRTPVAVQVVPVGGQTIQVPVSLGRAFFDDFEVDQAWVIGDAGDNATDGLWERADPNPSWFLGQISPDVDASPSGDGQCYVTENHGTGFVGTSDVDNGKTTMLSPVFDLTGTGTVILEYDRWFSNRAPSQSDDEFRVDISSNGGSSWTNLETLTVGNDMWSHVMVDLTPIVAITSDMRIRFVAEDQGADQYVEAAVDNVDFQSAVVGVELPNRIVTELGLETPTPNPFRETTRIDFALPTAGRAALDVFDVTGRKVASLVRAEKLAAGAHGVTWNGRDDRGKAVAPGVYFAKLVTDEGTIAKKMTYVR